MPRDFTLTDDDGGRVRLDGPVPIWRSVPTPAGPRSFTVLVNDDGVTTSLVVPYTVQAAPADGRRSEIRTFFGGRAPYTPQAFFDSCAVEVRDPLSHPTLGLAGGVAGAFEHTSVKDGPWSDPAVWSSGVVPGVTAATAGHSVRVAHAVTLDVQSQVILRDVLCARGSALRASRSSKSRLRADTIMVMGALDLGTSQSPVPESATPGEAFCEIVFHRVVDPGASARLGLMTMGPVRIHGAAKREWTDDVPNLAAGATSATIPGLAGFGWRVGDTLLVVGTSLPAGTSSDARYRGPLAYWQQGQGLKTASSFQPSQDEHRVITAISGDTVTWATGLAFARVSVQRPVVLAGGRPLQCRSRTVLEVVEGQALFHDLDCDETGYVASIQGGPDAAQVAVAMNRLTWAANGTRSRATAQDANGDHAYEVTFRFSAPGRASVDVPHTIRVLPAARVSATIADAFDRGDQDLTASAAYALLAGAAGDLAVRGNSLAVVTNNSEATVVDMGSLGSSQQRARMGFNGASNALVLLRLVDANNWLGLRNWQDPGQGYDQVFQAVMRVGGAETVLGSFTAGSNGDWDVWLHGDRLQVRFSFGSGGGQQWMPFYPRSGGLLFAAPSEGVHRVGELKLPSNAPLGHKVGVRGGGQRSPWLDHVTFERLPS